MPEHPPPPPTGASAQELLTYIDTVANGKYTDEVKVKYIQKASK